MTFKLKKSALFISVGAIVSLPIFMVSCSFSQIGTKASDGDLQYSSNNITYSTKNAQSSQKFKVTIIEKWNGVKTHSSVPGRNGHFQNIIWDLSDSTTNAFWINNKKASSNFANFTTSGATKGFNNHITGKLKYLYKYSFNITATQSSPFLTIATRFAPSPDWFGGVSGINLYNKFWLSSFNRNMKVYSSAVKDERFIPKNKNDSVITLNKNMNSGPDDQSNPFGYIKITPIT